MASFARVQEILDKAIAAWKTQHGRSPNLRVHSLAFGWATRDQLVNSTAFGKQLITADQITNRQGDQTNLVVALRTGVAPFARMPRGGPFISDPEIAEVVDWINSGALATTDDGAGGTGGIGGGSAGGIGAGIGGETP